MRTSCCNGEEKWQKIGILAYGCDGKRKVHKETRQMINKFRCQVQVWDRYDAVLLKVF